MLSPGAIERAGRAFLDTLGPELDRADPDGRVAPRSRLLCAALGLLAQATHDALGGGPLGKEVGLAAAALSLLTKIDDEVIDSALFHGGPSALRHEVRQRTRWFLEPTLASIRAAEPAADEPRCRLAAGVGARFRGLAGASSEGPERLARLLAMVEHGWAIQVDAVTILSSHPRAVTAAEVATVTRNISGAWLSMMALVGTLPLESATLTDDELEAIFDWGFHIQRADSLADLEKDRADGLGSTFVQKRLWDRSGVGPEQGSTAEIYRLVAESKVDLECQPEPEERAALRARLERVPELGELLGWIEQFLLHRYRCHRFASPTSMLRAAADDGGLWLGLLAKMDAAPATHGTHGAFERGAPCSAR
jgi:hypothetical protein